ncbi:Ger(x)C family spore germination protein [Neobacillus niacini]|uniref:Ger(x)C family spore germination protein n=1 Tax=Neobacillus niacini TaxID=86668 RepID=UPI0005EF2FFD|nr:Ger(x)C family spore germination protein [Neobacillus niacini]
MYKGLLYVSLCLLLTGCWDQVESEERGYVIGVGIDPSDHDTLEDRDEEEATEDSIAKERFKVTFQFVVPSALQGKGGESSQIQDPFLNVAASGNTMFQIVRNISKKIARSPYFQHIKMIIISDEVAKKGYLPEVLDFYLRDHEMRRETKIMITKDTSKDIFESRTKVERLPVMYIDSITDNAFKNGELLPPVNIGKVHKYLLGINSFLIPFIKSNGQKVDLSGSAIFKGDSKKMIGALNGMETMGVNFITGELKGGVIEVIMDGQLVVFEISDTKRKIHANVTNKDQIDFTIDVVVEGNLGEDFGDYHISEPKTVAKLEEKVAKEIEKITAGAIEKTQKEYNADVLGLGSYLHQEHYDSWKTIKNDWESGSHYFSKSNIRVNAKINARSIGTIIKTQK